ncbi:putative DD34D transposase [Trichonephila clavipes]|nr:putative DD34D transposase [Trichonephila clavipes]
MKANIISTVIVIEKNAVDTKAWLDKHYSDFAPGKSTVEKWFANFKRGEMSTEDDARSGLPKQAVTNENIKKVHKIIFDNRKVKLIER